METADLLDFLASHCHFAAVRAAPERAALLI
jgi:hypothetical protein